MKKHTSDNLSSDTIGGDVELGVGLTANTDNATSPTPTTSEVSFSIDAAEKHTNDRYKATNRDSSEITDSVIYDTNGEILSRVARAPTFYPQYMGGMQPESESDALIPDHHHHRHRSFSFSAMAPTNAPVVLVWKDLSVLTKTKPPKVLLNNISGQITGGFWAIMGSSGGGKTTLLSTISLRLDSSKMETIGTIRLNGNEYSTAVLKAMSAYVLQDDLLHAELTVKETIKYAADLRLSGKMDDKGRKQRQKDVIALMGIEHIGDTIIGDTRRKGISGGERKRVCVAIELLTAPKLMFLDEVGSRFVFLFFFPIVPFYPFLVYHIIIVIMNIKKSLMSLTIHYSNNCYCLTSLRSQPQV
jgi:ABC-type lipoprotein export system ATPase subunit